jgi:hypothetical protein
VKIPRERCKMCEIQCYVAELGLVDIILGWSLRQAR